MPDKILGIIFGKRFGNPVQTKRWMELNRILYTSDAMAAQANEIPTLEVLVEKAKTLFRETYGYEASAGGAAPGR